MFPPAFFNILKEPSIVYSTETNDTSKERSDTQLFGAEKCKGRGFIKRAPRPLFAKEH